MLLGSGSVARGAPVCAIAPSDAQPAADPVEVIAAIAAESATQVAPPTSHVAVPSGDLGGVHIRLERGACLGTCPAYSVDVFGDGRVVWNGYAVFPGEHRSQVDPQAVAELVEELRAADFWSLSPVYAANMTDNSVFKVTLTIGGQTKSVEDYIGRAVGMPEAVTRLENDIDRVADTERWIRGNERTLPSLEQEGWSFHSRAAGEALARAAQDAPELVVLGLIERGAPADIPAEMLMESEPRTAIENAAVNGRLRVMRALIGAGAFSREGAKEAALRAAVGSQRPEVVAEVLKYGPDVNAQDRAGDTALLRMATGAHPFGSQKDPCRDDAGIVELLLKAGADPNLQNGEGNTLLHESFDVDAVRVLLRNGARPNVRNKEGETPLLATWDEDVALALIEAGANISAKSKDGRTVQDVATTHKWEKVLARLKRR